MSNRFQKARKLIDELKKRHELVSLGMIRKAIIIECGADENRVVVPYLNMMREMGMIKETIKGWKLN